MRFGLLYFSIVAIAALPAAAVAEPSVHSQSLSVSYADLDLSQSEDVARLEQRLDRASRQVCGGNPRFDPSYRQARAAVTAAFETCRLQALSDARTSIVAARESREQGS